jgi:integrase
LKDSELKKYVRTTKKLSRTKVDKNLFIRISKELTATFVFLIRNNGAQKQITLGRYGNRPDEITLAEARDLTAELRSKFRKGFDPHAANINEINNPIKTFNDLAENWLLNECSDLKNPQIPERIYRKEIKPKIGGMKIDVISGLNIQKILKEVAKSGRPTIANDTLLHLKQIFSHGIRLGVTNSNPASAFSNKQAGGKEASRERYLELKEIKKLFSVFRRYNKHFVHENYIALAILLLTGVRKTELTQATWKEFNLDTIKLDNGLTWKLPEERAKNNKAIAIPIPDELVPYFKLLKALSFGSEYVFPSRRAGKKGYISDDTLNHALTNLFGKKTGKNKSTTGNVLGKAGIDYFVIHDLRRTCRTLLSSLSVDENVAEKCLNHKVKGVEGIYNQYAYFGERKLALQKLAGLVFPLIDTPEITIQTRRL